MNLMLSDLSLDLYELINSQLLDHFILMSVSVSTILYCHNNLYNLCVFASADTFTRCFIICVGFNKFSFLFLLFFAFVHLVGWLVDSLFWRFVTQYTCAIIVVTFGSWNKFDAINGVAWIFLSNRNSIWPFKWQHIFHSFRQFI